MDITDLDLDVLTLRRGSRREDAGRISVHLGEEGPLSFAQSRLAYLQLLDPASSQYNMPYAFRAEGELDLPVLREALAWLLERHAVLRSGIHLADGEPVQRIHPLGEADLSEHDLRALEPETAEMALRAMMAERVAIPFALERGVMLRTDVALLPRQQTLVLLTMHHIASDGWSLGILIAELSAAYAAFAQGRLPTLPPLPIRYLDFAAWEQNTAARQADRHYAYWERQLAEADAIAELPHDRPRRVDAGTLGGTVSLTLGPHSSNALRELARQESATGYAVAMAAFAVALSRLGGAATVQIGTPTANRTRAETQGLVGFFVNMLVMRLDVDESASFRALVQAAKLTATQAQVHQSVPYEHLVKRLGPAQHRQRGGLFQVGFSYEVLAIVAGPMQFGEHAATIESLPHQTAKFDFTVNVVDTGGELVLVAEYASDVFERSRIERICAQYRDTLTALLAAPDLPLAALTTTAPALEPLVPVTHCSAELFARLQSHAPQAIALDGEVPLDYATLLARVERLAARLRLRGLGPGDVVGLLIADRATLIISMLATLRMGAAFLILDADYPLPRLRYMLANGRCHCLLRQGTVPPLDASVVIELDADDGDGPADAGPVRNGPVSAVLHTSGSTGEPKAVALPVSGLIQHALRMQQLGQMGPQDRVLQFNAPAFDAFLEEVFTTLISGARLLLPAQRLLDPLQFCSYVQATRASILNLPTAYWHALTYQLDETKAASLRSVRSVVVGGEAASADALRHWLRLCPQAAWTNAYGPTEATVSVLADTVDQLPADDAMPFGPALGTALSGSRVHVLDAWMRPVLDGAPGQLHIEGSGLAYGYVGRPAATAERFVPNPFGTPGSRLYATGDLCRQDADGQLLFLGRSDRQIKLNGHRIELGEIEKALLACAGVSNVAAGVHRQDGASDYAYACVAASEEVTAQDLQAALRERLPAYMVPSRVLVIAAVPLTVSGKVDHAAILAALSDQAHAQAHRAPETALQKVVAALWEEQFQLARVGLDDDFFSVGGHSIAAIRFIARFNSIFRIEVGLVVVLDHARLQDFCAKVSEIVHDSSALERDARLLVQLNTE